MIRELIDGVFAHLRAFELISRYNLWIYVLAPGILSILLGVVIFGAAFRFADDIGAAVISIYPFEAGKGVVETIIAVIGGIAIVAIGLLVFRHLIMAIASPFMSFLSEKIEKKLRGSQEAQFSIKKFFSDLVRGLTIALRNIIRELFYTVLLLMLSGIIPFLAPLVAVALFLIQAYYAGFGNMDFTLERHFGVRGSVLFVRKHWGLAIGNGLVFLLLLFTGIGFLFALPLGAIAAATETLKKL